MSDPLDDLLDDDLEDELEGDDSYVDDDLEGDGDYIDDDLEDELEGGELGIDYNVADQDVRALSAARDGVLMRPKILGSAVHLDGTDTAPNNTEHKHKVQHNGTVVRIEVYYSNGRKLTLTSK